MNKSIYMKNGIIQRIISSESYDIMKICKRCGNYDSTIEEIQKYILELYYNTTYYSDIDLYNYLLEVAFDIFDENHIKQLFKNGINDCFNKKMFENNFVYTPINCRDLINMLITNISLVQFRTQVDGEYTDLYLIEDNKQVLSAEEYTKKLEMKKDIVSQ